MENTEQQAVIWLIELSFKLKDRGINLFLFWCSGTQCCTVSLYFGECKDKTKPDYFDYFYTNDDITPSGSKIIENINRKVEAYESKKCST